MEWKRDVNTNLGITVILIFSALFVIVDFFVIGAHIDGYPFTDLNGTVAIEDKDNSFIEDKDVVEDGAILFEEEALVVGNEMYEKACQSYYGIYETKGVSVNYGPEYVYYVRLQDNSFQNDESGSFMKLLVDDMKNVFTSEMFNNLFFIKDAYYIVGSDNNYYMQSLGVGGDPTYIESKLFVDNIQNDVITFSVKSYYDVETNDDLDDVKESKFVIKKENDEWKVSDFTLPF